MLVKEQLSPKIQSFVFHNNVFHMTGFSLKSFTVSICIQYLVPIASAIDYLSFKSVIWLSAQWLERST